MTDRNLRIAISVMVVLIVVVLVATAMVMNGRRAPAPSASPGASAAIASATPSGDATATPGDSGEPSASPDANASPTPTPEPTVPLATLTVVDLELDATDDADGVDRVVTFKSDGAGTIEVNLTAASGEGNTHMCLLRGKNEVGCQDLGSGTFTGQTSRDSATWHVTLRGAAAATPTVKVKLTFQALDPSVKIAHARFDGTDAPDTNGIEVRFKVRSAGDATLSAKWGDDFTYDIDVVDQDSGSGDVTLSDQGPASGVDQSWPVKAGVWRIILSNSEPGTGATELTATVGWP